MIPETPIHPRDGAKTIGQKQLSIVLFVLLAVIYFGFYLFAITAPDLLAQPIINAIPLSFVLGAAIIIASVVITFVYAFSANWIDKKEGESL